VPFRNKNLLLYIVDDDESVCKSMLRLMRSAGIESIAFESAERFLSEVRNDPRACIVMDINMPNLNGLQLCRLLKDRGINLPVIAVSARDDEETMSLAQSLGVRLYLHKPVDDQALLDAIYWMVSDDMVKSEAAT
jgi:FixJ family two-component response regulator